jgi:hypothetical protein
MYCTERAQMKSPMQIPKISGEAFDNLEVIRPQLISCGLKKALGLDRIGDPAFFAEQEICIEPIKLWNKFSQPFCLFESHFKPVADSIECQNGRANKLFESKFIPFQSEFHLKRWRNKYPYGCKTFAMFLTSSEINKFVSYFDELNHDHVGLAFAYIRFYQINDSFIVVEIQSDLYGQLREEKSRLRYNNWHRQLLAGFHHYVHSHCRNIIAIYIVDEKYINDRYSEINRGLSRRLYSQTPKAFGYERVTGLRYKFEPAHSPKSIKSAWRLWSHSIDTPLNRIIEKYSTTSKENRLLNALQTCCADEVATLSDATLNHIRASAVVWEETWLSKCLRYNSNLRSTFDYLQGSARLPPGNVLMFRFGDGRAYDHLKHSFPDRSTIVVSRNWHGGSDHLPPLEHRLDFETISSLIRRPAGCTPFALIFLNDSCQAPNIRVNALDGVVEQILSALGPASFFLSVQQLDCSDFGLEIVLKRNPWFLYRKIQHE